MTVPDFLRPAPDSLWSDMLRTSSNPRLHLGNVLWSLWVLATLFFTPVSASFWWSLAIGYPLFLLLFALVHVRPKGELNFYVSIMAMLAFVSMMWNPAAWSYLVFACVYSGLSHAGSIREGAMKILMMQAVLVVWAWWLDWPWFIMLMAVCVCSSSGFGAMLGYSSRLKDAQLRLSQDEVRRLAVTAERERIGRDLHDLLGHTLSLITLKLELSRKLFDRDGEAARRELEEAEKIARKALAEVRAAVTGMRAAGIAGELASARLLLQGSGVEFDYELDADDLPADVECALALVLREAVTNIHRHAHARHADVTLSAPERDVRLTISDDGRGGIRVDGNGLGGMRERVRALGGRLEIESPAGGGTRITITVPRRIGPDAAAAVAAPSVSIRGHGMNEGPMPVPGAAGGHA